MSTDKSQSQQREDGFLPSIEQTAEWVNTRDSDCESRIHTPVVVGDEGKRVRGTCSSDVFSQHGCVGNCTCGCEHDMGSSGNLQRHFQAACRLQNFVDELTDGERIQVRYRASTTGTTKTVTGEVRVEGVRDEIDSNSCDEKLVVGDVAVYRTGETEAKIEPMDVRNRADAWGNTPGRRIGKFTGARRLPSSQR